MATPTSALSTKLAQGGIIAAAAEVFARQGFAAARVEDLLEAAGIARRTFYKYFTGKEEVLAALYELATTELYKAVASAATSGDALGAVRAGVDAYLDYHADNARLLRVLVEQAIRSDSPLSPLRRRFRDELAQLIDAAVRARTGEVNDVMLYTALISALEGLSLDLLSSGASSNDVTRAKRVMHLLIDRVTVAPSPVTAPLKRGKRK